MPSVNKANGTPSQAVSNDYFWTENDLLASSLASGSVVNLDVIADDHGGNAKKLVSLDAAGGFPINIVDGNVALDLGDALAALGASSIDALAEGEIITTSFAYATQVGKGAISWATVTFTLVGENDSPTDITLSGTSVHGNAPGAVIGTLSTTDVDHDESFTYAIDDDRFEVVDGVLKLKDGIALDAAEPTVAITVTSTDSAGAAISETFGIGVLAASQPSPTVYFAANRPATGYEIYKLDADGTTVTLVADVAPGIQSSFPSDFTEFNGSLYFQARTPTTGSELFKVNGDGSVELVADLAAGTQSSSPHEMTEFNGALYFSGSTAATGSELFKLDADGNVVLAVDLTSGTQGSFPVYLTEFDGSLYFRAYTPQTGDELFKLDADGSVTAIELVAGPQGSDPQSLTVIDGRLYFSAFTPETGYELFSLDADGKLTSFDIVAGSDGSSPMGFTEFNDSIYFQASTPTTGAELYRLTPADTIELVADIAPGTEGSSPYELTAFDGSLYFGAHTGSTGWELFKLAADGTVTNFDINPGAGSSTPWSLTAFDGALYLNAYTPGTGSEFYSLDADDTLTLVADINVGPGSGDPYDWFLF